MCAFDALVATCSVEYDARDAETKPPPLDSRRHIYEYERILDKRIDEDGRTMYLIVWRGYPLEDATWEPETCFVTPEAKRDKRRFDAVWSSS